MAGEVPEFFRRLDALGEAMGEIGWVDRVYRDKNVVEIHLTHLGEKKLREIWSLLGPLLPALEQEGASAAFLVWLRHQAKARSLPGTD